MEFLSCLECFEGLIDETAWDPAAFAAAVDERIVAPGVRAQEILLTYPTVTRMYTTLSPHEMTEDPFFHGNVDLFPVDLTTVAASINRPCSGNQTATVPSLRTSFSVSAPDLSLWPTFENMPAAVRVEEIPPVGAPMTLVDNEEAINLAIAEWQQTNAAAIEPRCHDDYPYPGDTDSAGADADDGGLKGCGCQTQDPRPGWGALALGLLVMLRLHRSRRRD